ncbi:MAG TPA: 4Fe-4S binding protein [Elusimicrobiales bacterium]|nr:4Fe-4S binding protein [Elusimicrobiales bacterium]
MKRKIIEIDQDKCDGCGLCASRCAEGAIRIIDGKARLVAENYCDGLGACIGSCPRGAITVTERQAQPYDERSAMENIIKGGPAAVRAHLEHLASHGQKEYIRQAKAFLEEQGLPVPEVSVSGGHSCGGHACPGSKPVDMRDKPVSNKSEESQVSELRQWPVQLKLLNPSAPYFNNADLLIAADCVPFACAGFHGRLLRGKILIVFCPKLDSDLEGYVEKLAEIFRTAEVRSVTVAHMEVPCCSAALALTKEALERAGKQLAVEDVTVKLDGGIICK